MGDVLVKRATVAGGTIVKLEVALHGIPPRTIDRDTAIAWLRDGHSLIPVLGGQRLAALQLVGEDSPRIRRDHRAADADDLPPLPAL